MASKKWGKSHMAWVRSFQRKRHNPSRRRRHGRKNAYPVAGMVLNRRRRRHYRSNPGGGGMRVFGFQLPNFGDVLWGAGGFVATPLLEGILNPMLPAAISTNLLGKYALRIGIVVGETYLAKKMLGNRAAAAVGVGAGSYVLISAVRDFAPVEMRSWLGLSAYAPAPRGMGIAPIGGQVANMASYPATRGRNVTTLGRLSSPSFGAQTRTGGGSAVVPARFQRFSSRG